MPLRLALYQPDIPQNAGALLRLGACLGLAVEVIDPAGFLWDDRKLRRAGMDYVARAEVIRHPSWADFDAARRAAGRRLVLLSTAGEQRLDRFAFGPDDVLLLGRETAGVPESVAAAADARVRVPMRAGLRSLNVALAAALAVGCALSRTAAWPAEG
ncbi:MAG: tRNA methyltransferase [Magnetospirillum sp.]|nr:tRNA methyltransferase [Magnetospirillum sp.]